MFDRECRFIVIDKYWGVSINIFVCFFFFKQKTPYELRISDCSSDVCSSDLLTSRFSTGAVDHALVTGLELTREKSENKSRNVAASLPAADFNNPNPGDPFSFTPTYTGARTEATVDTIAIYAFDTAKLSEQWEISGGLRWDHVDSDVTSVAAGGGVTEFSRTDEMPSWQVGWVYKPLPNGSVYAAYGT